MDASNASIVDVADQQLPGSENDDELMDEDELLDLPGDRLYPSDAHLILVNHLLQLRGGNHGAMFLVPCLKAVHSILLQHQHGHKIRSTDLDTIRKFLRDDFLYSVDKMLQFPNSIKVSSESLHEGALQALQWSACVAAEALQFRAQLDPADASPDLDEDLVPVAQAMLNLFNQNKTLHCVVMQMDLPASIDLFQLHVDLQYAMPVQDPEDLDQNDPDEPVVEKHRWLVALINTFAGFHGFDAILTLLQRPGSVTFPLLNMMAAVLAQVVDFLTDEAHEHHQKVVGPILQHVTELVEMDHDRLHDYGSDRTYNTFQCLVNINLQRIAKYGQNSQRNLAQLKHIQRTFVLKMLESSTFNKLLSGVRECNKLLKEAAKSRSQLQALVQWIEQNDIVQRILRTNLHQKQYVQEVQGIMIVLTMNQFLTPEHLDMLWAVIEKEDTYDAVKTHMFELLGEVASRFVPSQLDMLFAKLERRQDRNVQDTTRLLMLLERLAKSDKEMLIEDKVINMVWDITIPATAPRELQDVKALTNVFTTYALHSSAIYPSVKDSVKKCFSALIEGKGGQVPLLRCLRDLIKWLEHQPSGEVQGSRTLQDKIVDDLINNDEALGQLVTKLCQKVSAAAEAIKSAGIDCTDEAAQTAVAEAAIATLGEGQWTYTDIVKEYLHTLKMLASISSTYFDMELAEKLWDTLMVEPPFHEDQLNATQAFFRAGFQGDKTTGSCSTFEHPTQQALLEKHMVLQDASRVVTAAAKLFLDVFHKVNLENRVVKLYTLQAEEPGGRNRTVPIADQLPGIKGLDFIWAMYLHNPDRRVAQITKELLLQLYHAYVDAIESAPYRKELVKRLVSSLQTAAANLLGKPGDAADACLAVSRCLSLALAAVAAKESKTMPPVPAHQRAWRGMPLQLELQQQHTTGRVRIASHSNEYVGLLRERVARQLFCNWRNIRLLVGGHEMKNDAAIIPYEAAKGRAVFQVLNSPVANLFTQSPAEYRPYYEEWAFAWLLSQADGLYPLLLRLVDLHSVDAEVPNMALELLSTMPTYSALTQQIAAALDGPDKHKQLAAVFNSDSNSISSSDSSKSKMEVDAPQFGLWLAFKPYQTLYALQALCALLFPTFDEQLLPVCSESEEENDNQMADASACPSPAGTAGPASAAAPMQPAASAALEVLHKVQHREQQQQEFLQNRGLEVVIEAAYKAAESTKCDLKLRRQLSELLVMLLHNLIDKAHEWTGHIAGPAESRSGADAGTGNAVAAAASSQKGGVAAAAEGEAAAMSGVQQQLGEGGSSSDAAHTAAPAGQHALADSQPQTAPGSPSMEDAMSPPLVGNQQRKQQQQTGKQQRQRASDLPPLPPAAQAGNGNASNPVSASVQTLAAVFGPRTLKLVAETLQRVAVDTAQLWGSRVTPLVIDEDDKAAVAEAERDVSVVKDALGLLNHLLQHQPLVQQLLLEGVQSPLITVVLVNPHYAPLRRQAADLLEKLVASDVHPKLLQWLLLQLSAARKVAESVPASSSEFYELLSAAVTRLGLVSSSNWGAVPQQLFTVAGQILDDEVAQLQAVAAAPAASGSIDEAEAACTLLQGRLQLVTALVRTLDRRSVGSDSEGGLIRLLLQDFLFPEAVQQLTVATGTLDLANCAAKLEPRCATPSCRKATLELLSELMGDTAASLEEGVALLIDLHYQQCMLGGWGMSPRMSRPPGNYMGLKNGGATCYMNAVFQQLFMQPQIRAGVLSAAEVEASEAGESVFAQLQAMFATMALGKATFHAPKDFWYAFKDYDGSPIDVKEHQDAYEFFTRLQDFVDQHLTSTGQPPAIKPVMGGTFVQQIICRGVDYTSEREEEFYQISVDVKGMGSLEKSLDDYVKGELMEGDNAYLVEHLGKRVAAVKRTAVKQLPQMLCIHLKRFEFDYHNQTRYKVRDRFEFPLELDMFKYSAAGLALQDQQQKAAEQQGQPPGTATSSADGAASSSATTSASGGAALGRQLSDAVQQALAAKQSEAGGTGGSAYMYDLKGVVVHAGSAFTGHYYSYIQERPAPGSSTSSSEAPDGQWFSFDDKQVRPWDVIELESECFGGKPSQDSDGRTRPHKNEYERANSAYMLFYERRQTSATASSSGQKQQSSSGSKQQHAQPAAAANGDVSMTGAAEQPGQFAVPYGMPVSLYKQVVQNNIHLMWCQHVLDKDYFRFVKQLVVSKGDLGQLSNRKARRREASIAVGGAVGSGSSGGRLQSSMSIDLPAAASGSTAPAAASGAAAGARTPTVIINNSGPDSTVASPSPMAVSPASAAAAAAAPQPLPADVGGNPVTPAVGAFTAPTAAAALNTPRLSPLTLSPARELQASPGPSSRRGEEAEAVAVALLRLGVLFQFQVYLRAADSLRTEASVWTEALMGLMGSGPSSGACLQAFLELAVLHTEWLQQYLLDADNEVPNLPKRWAYDNICWSFETAAKRVSAPLSQYMQQFLALQQLYLEPGAVPGQPSVTCASHIPAHQQLHVEQHYRVMQQALPPLAAAVLAFVDKLVLLVRDCVPVKRSSRDANVLLDPPDVPGDAVRILRVYAALGPWAAAHLMMAVNIVPDLAEIINQYVRTTEDDDYLAEEIAAHYELLYELLQHASNLPQLSEELSNTQNSLGGPNPYLTRAALAASLAGAESAAAEQGNGSLLSVKLPQQAYNLLCTEFFLQGLMYVGIVSSPRVVDLAGLLTWNNNKLATPMLKLVGNQLLKSLHAEQASNNSKPLWDVPRRHWSLIALQPDGFMPQRAAYWLLGTFNTRNLMDVPVALPGLLCWGDSLSWQTIYHLRFINSFVAYLEQHVGPASYSKVRQFILALLGQQKNVTETLINLQGIGGEQNLQEVAEVAGSLLQEIQQEVEPQQQQVQQQYRRSDPRRQQQQVTAADDAGTAADAEDAGEPEQPQQGGSDQD